MSKFLAHFAMAHPVHHVLPLTIRTPSDSPPGELKILKLFYLKSVPSNRAVSGSLCSSFKFFKMMKGQLNSSVVLGAILFLRLIFL